MSSVMPLPQSNVKDINPKDAIGIAKVPMSVIPCNVLMEVGLALMEGARKYGRHNYRVSGVRASVYYDAAMRHLMAWWEGEDIDPDSELSHVTKAITSLIVLRDALQRNMCTDDRPPRQGLVNFTEFVDACNAGAAELIEKYPADRAPHTEKGQQGATIFIARTANPTDSDPDLR